ncbi:MAG: DUF1588 domain-containing protein [Myxococcales bacterium]|nr:DUF1588 domain-containing protein [Myxococcales bacterium]
MTRTMLPRTLPLALAAATLPGCTGGAEQGEHDNVPPQAFVEGISPAVRDRNKAVVVDPTVDYGLALRTAALKLVGAYPTLAEIKELQAASDPAAVFAKRIAAYLADPRFSFEQVAFWRDTFKLGGTRNLGMLGTVNMDSAPMFAASLVVSGRPFTEVLTASSGTCPTLAANGTFTPANCANGIEAVGVLTDPGVQSQFFSSMAFRRVRWVQETFICTKFPAEISDRKEQRPGGTYYSPWPFTSISGGKDARVDFHDDRSLICANCHSTMNHIAPLFGKFDEAGRPTPNYAVRTPIPGSPPTLFTDWLPPTEMTAWRFGVPTANLKALGAAIAADPDMPRCIATRIWNWALSRGDVVVDQATVPKDLGEQLRASFVASNYNLKQLIYDVFTSATFVRY